MDPPTAIAIASFALAGISVVVLLLRAGGRSQKISIRGMKGNVSVGDVAGDLTMSYTDQGQDGEEPPPKRDWVDWALVAMVFIGMVSGVINTILALRGAGGS